MLGFYDNISVVNRQDDIMVWSVGDDSIGANIAYLVTSSNIAQRFLAASFKILYTV